VDVIIGGQAVDEKGTIEERETAATGWIDVGSRPDQRRTGGVSKEVVGTPSQGLKQPVRVGGIWGHDGGMKDRATE
jgi:hypothetical protein